MMSLRIIYRLMNEKLAGQATDIKINETKLLYHNID